MIQTVRMPFGPIIIIYPSLHASLPTSPIKSEKELNKRLHTPKTSLTSYIAEYHNLDSLEISSSCKVQSMMKPVQQDDLAHILESV